DRAATNDGPMKPWTARHASGTFAADAHTIEIVGALESFSGGEVSGRYVGLKETEGGPRSHQVTLEGRGLRLEPALRHYDLPGDDDIAPSATVSGSATVRWIGPDLDRMAGDARLTFHPEPGHLPVSGSATVTWRGRQVTIASCSLETAGSRLEMTGL